MAVLLYYFLNAGIISFILQNAQSARIDIVPDGFIEAVTETVSITCTLDGTATKAEEILVMEISKDGATPIVNMKPPDKIQYGKPQTDHYEVHGMVNNSNIAKSYLNLTINYPSKEDSGIYTCVLSYIDEVGLVKQDTSQAELRLNVSDQSNTEARVRNLETALDNLIDRIKEVEKDNADLQAENRNQSTQIQLLTEKVDYTVAFSAAVGDDKRIATGDIVVFSDVMLNEGQGYSASTGIFTAPRAGLYAFHLVLEIGQGGSYGEIYINVAGNDVAKMYLQDKDFGDQGAITTVSRLMVGDVVKVVVFTASGNSPNVFAERLCVFSGFLIKP